MPERATSGRPTHWPTSPDTLQAESGSFRLERTSFADENIQERARRKAALRDHIDLIDSDLHIVAEEFGDFEGANRRIDSLCLDRDYRLVVVELNRTVGGIGPSSKGVEGNASRSSVVRPAGGLDERE
jgi:hypothetical protein